MRRKEDLNKLRRILLQGSKSWGELLKLTRWSPSVLKNRIDYLERIEELRAETGNRKGRRTTLYKLANKDRSEANVEKYDAIQFIEGIQNPIYSFQLSDDKKVSVSVFVSSVDPPFRKTMQIMARSMAKDFLPFANRLFIRTRRGLKVAVVLTKQS